ncbi:MAG: alcohol dehydrogenase catalytic domain-containing protein, partial [Cyclobacteriaceae bacterium]
MQYKALLITETPAGTFDREIVERPIDDLPAGDVLVRVHYSALNYKDGLSATGHKGITRKFPHTPGIEAAGKVVSSTSDKFREGSEVFVTVYDLVINTS